MSAYPQYPCHDDEKPITMELEAVIHHANRGGSDETALRAREFMGHSLPPQPAAVLHEIHANRRLMERREKDRERQRRYRKKKKANEKRGRWYSK